MFKAYLIAGLITVVATAGGLAAYRYFSMSSELLEIKAALVQQEAENARLVGISNRNAEAAKRADEDRRAAIEALEHLQAGLEVITKQARVAEADIEAAPEVDDGPVAAVLERLRASRFGGPK
jgi:chromatin segregation and condensation protein Rec8/ScpA/Scc1 (kleisin family)